MPHQPVRGGGLAPRSRQAQSEFQRQPQEDGVCKGITDNVAEEKGGTGWGTGDSFDQLQLGKLLEGGTEVDIWRGVDVKDGHGQQGGCTGRQEEAEEKAGRCGA